MNSRAYSSSEFKLETGVILVEPWMPFEVSQQEIETLRSQRISGFFHKNISFNCSTGKIIGSSDDRLGTIFSRIESQWFEKIQFTLPGYSSFIKPWRIVLNNSEAATRKIRLESRDDLLHFDIPPQILGKEKYRLLKCAVNLADDSDRVMAIGPTLKDLLISGILGNTSIPNRSGLNAIDNQLWKKLHHELKRDLVIQKKIPRKIARFPGGSHWMAMTDGLVHATLRGASVLEFHALVDFAALEMPEFAPCCPIILNSDSPHFSEAA